MIKGIHIGENGYEVATIDGSLESLYQICKCDLIDVAYVTIKGKPFDVICDDEGLFKPEEELFCRVFSRKFGARIVGDVFVCSHNEAEFESLTDEEIELIRSRIGGGILVVD